ncbi:MAG: CCA tRNA nucleotidyltransferase [Leptolyngbyaceae cyanobacterium]
MNQTSLEYGLDNYPNLAAVFSALSPHTWPFSLEWLPDHAFLVGGSVRDALLGRQSEYLDLDFVLLEGAVETAQAIARRYRAGFVLLDPERQIARVVFPQGTADFAAQVGPTLEADLGRRDFTLNAIAYDPHCNQIIDPLRGYEDLQKCQIRMVAPENLEEDPLRLLRAYRQAAQLGFSLETETQQVISKLAPLLNRMAAERVQSELNYLLNSPQGTPWLQLAWQDGLLKDWLPSASDQKVALLAAIDRKLVVLQERSPDFAPILFERARGKVKAVRVAGHSSQNSLLTTDGAPGATRNWLTLAKLASLLSSDPEQAEAQLRRLKYSRTEIQSVSTSLRFLPDLWAAVKGVDSPAPALVLSLREQCLFFQQVGATFPAIVLLALASGLPLNLLQPLIDRFLTADDPVAHPSPLVTGQDLMTHLQLAAGPQIGRLLAEIQLARAEGVICDREDALEFAENFLATEFRS